MTTLRSQQSSPKGAENKALWGVFLNLARHNVYTTINYINAQLDLPLLSSDDAICTIKERWKMGNKSQIQRGCLYDLITKHFPFVATMVQGEAQRKYHRNTKESKVKDTMKLDPLVCQLVKLLECLQSLRNCYSHSEHSQIESSLWCEVAQCLGYVFEANILQVKQDHQSNDQVSFSDFDHIVLKDRKSAVQNASNYHFSFTNDEGLPSEHGLLFFTSLFLAKRDAIWMQGKVRGLKNSNEKRWQMTKEVFCRSRILLPRPKLESTYTSDQLLLDMLGELARCPRSLYERLKGDKRKLFHSVEQWEEEEENPFKNILVRHSNRFPYFALRYFDLVEALPHMRFQIDLGTYHFALYQKTIGQSDEIRHLTKSLYTFGRLQDLDDVDQPHQWQRMVRELKYCETSDEPYIQRTRAHYHLMHNKIGIRISDGDSTPLWPALDLAATELKGRKPKYVRKQKHKADAFLSVHELPPMMFYYLLLIHRQEANPGQRVEGIIKGFIRDIGEVYDAFERDEIKSLDDLDRKLDDIGKNIDNRRLLRKHFPVQMLEILSNKDRDMSAKASLKIKCLIEDTDRRIAKIEKQADKRVEAGDYRSEQMKSGHIASWLVADFMRFRRMMIDKGHPTAISQVNSTTYQLIQRSLALFNENEDCLHRYLREANLLDTHPFLNQTDILNCRQLQLFYKEYLKARKRYLEGLTPANWQSYRHCLRLGKSLSEHDKTTLVKGWKQCLNLPRGLYTQAIESYLEKHPELLEKLNDRKKKYPKYTGGMIPWLIPAYYGHIRGIHVQSFYDEDINVNSVRDPRKGQFLSPRDRKKKWHKYRKTLRYATLKDKKSSDKMKMYLQFRDWQRCEKELRQTKSQDLLLWDMCLHLLEKKEAVGKMNAPARLELKLSELGQESSKSRNILSEIVPMSRQVSWYEVDDKGSVLREKRLGTIKIEERRSKALKLGNLRALVDDRRLNGLLSFINQKSLDTLPLCYGSLMQEFESYQSVRVKACELFLSLEKAILRRHDDLPKDNFRKMIDKLKTKGGYDEEVMKAMDLTICVRNAFFHNQYPMYCASLFEGLERPCLEAPKICQEGDKEKVYYPRLNVAREIYRLVDRAVRIIISIL